MSPKKSKPIKQNPVAFLDQSGKNLYQHQSEQWKTKTTFKLLQTKLSRDPSESRIKWPKRINKQNHTNKQKWCNAEGPTKSLNRSSSIESMDIETDNIIANLNLADI